MRKNHSNARLRRCHVHGARLREDVGVDVHHQVTSSRVLHNKTHVLWSLEAREQVDQERVVRHVHDLKDALLAHETARGARKGQEVDNALKKYTQLGTILPNETLKTRRAKLTLQNRVQSAPFYFIPSYYVPLLQGFDGVHRPRLLILRQQHLHTQRAHKSNTLTRKLKIQPVGSDVNNNPCTLPCQSVLGPTQQSS